MSDCIFCRIAVGSIPADIVARNDHAVAFRDLTPQAPTHILIVPVEHFDSAAAATGEAGRKMFGEVMALGVEVAAALKLERDGYRFVMNTGRDGGQSVGHVHLHLLAGRQLHWPPG